MPLELDSKRNVLTSYGVRTSNSAYGADQGPDVVHKASVEFTAPTSGAGSATNGLAAAAWAKGGLDLVIPAGATFLRADLVVEEAFNALTALTIGTYAASNGTTAVAVEGFVTAVNAPLVNVDAVGDRVLGSGTQLVTGTAGLGATLVPTVIRALYTGAVPTVGKARLSVHYLLKAA